MIAVRLRCGLADVINDFDLRMINFRNNYWTYTQSPLFRLDANAHGPQDNYSLKNRLNNVYLPILCIEVRFFFHRITKRMGEDTMKVTAQNNEQERTVKN